MVSRLVVRAAGRVRLGKALLGLGARRGARREAGGAGRGISARNTSEKVLIRTREAIPE